LGLLPLQRLVNLHRINEIVAPAEFRRELDQSLGLALLPVRSQRLDQDRQRGRGKRFSGKRLLR
jgi:hypothetical protein